MTRTVFGSSGSSKRKRTISRTETARDHEQSQVSSSRSRKRLREGNAEVVSSDPPEALKEVLTEGQTSQSDDEKQVEEDVAKHPANHSDVQEERDVEQKEAQEAGQWLDEQCGLETLSLANPTLHEPFSGWVHQDKDVRYNFDYDADKDYSDVKVICGNSLFRLHKLKICQISAFFKKACKPQWQEGQQNKISLNDSDPMAIQLTLEWIYTAKYQGVTEVTKKYVAEHPLSRHVKVAAEARLLLIEPLIQECLKNFRDKLRDITFDMCQEACRLEFVEACRIIYDNNLETYTRDVQLYAQDHTRHLVNKEDPENCPWTEFLADNHSACFHAFLTMHQKLHHSQFWPPVSEANDGNAYVGGQKRCNQRGKKKNKQPEVYRGVILY